MDCSTSVLMFSSSQVSTTLNMGDPEKGTSISSETLAENLRKETSIPLQTEAFTENPEKHTSISSETKSLIDKYETATSKFLKEIQFRIGDDIDSCKYHMQVKSVTASGFKDCKDILDYNQGKLFKELQDFPVVSSFFKTAAANVKQLSELVLSYNPEIIESSDSDGFDDPGDGGGEIIPPKDTVTGVSGNLPTNIISSSGESFFVGDLVSGSLTGTGTLTGNGTITGTGSQTGTGNLTGSDIITGTITGTDNDTVTGTDPLTVTGTDPITVTDTDPVTGTGNKEVPVRGIMASLRAERLRLQRQKAAEREQLERDKAAERDRLEREKAAAVTDTVPVTGTDTLSVDEDEEVPLRGIMDSIRAEKARKRREEKAAERDRVRAVEQRIENIIAESQTPVTRSAAEKIRVEGGVASKIRAPIQNPVGESSSRKSLSSKKKKPAPPPGPNRFVSGLFNLVNSPNIGYIQWSSEGNSVIVPSLSAFDEQNDASNIGNWAHIQGQLNRHGFLSVLCRENTAQFLHRHFTSSSSEKQLKMVRGIQCSSKAVKQTRSGLQEMWMILPHCLDGHCHREGKSSNSEFGFIL